MQLAKSPKRKTCQQCIVRSDKENYHPYLNVESTQHTDGGHRCRRFDRSIHREVKTERRRIGDGRGDVQASLDAVKPSQQRRSEREERERRRERERKRGDVINVGYTR